MLSILIDTLRKVGIENIVVITGAKGDKVEAEVGKKARFVSQKEQLGTAHAVLQTKSILKNKTGKLLLFCGDAPLIQPDTVKDFIAFNTGAMHDASVVTMNYDDPTGYGRIIKDNADNVLRIVEEADASREETAICEVNSGIYCFDLANIFPILGKIQNDNKQGEYYLTDSIHLLNKEEKRIKTFCLPDPREAIGVNSRQDIIIAEKLLREMIVKRLIDQGVTILDPTLTYIEEDVTVGENSVISPFVTISCGAVIGSHCHLAPFVHIKSGQIVGDYETVKQTGILGEKTSE